MHFKSSIHINSLVFIATAVTNEEYRSLVIFILFYDYDVSVAIQLAFVAHLEDKSYDDP